jgi:transposase
MMQELPPLDGLSHKEKDALIHLLWDELQRLRATVERHEAQLAAQNPAKTSENSSQPPSKGFKANKAKSKQGSKAGKKRGKHSSGGRPLSANPDQTVVAHAQQCPHCSSAVSREEQKLRAIYERIELPIVPPQVTRVERYGGQCGCCGKTYDAPVPVGLAPGSPYGNSIASLVSYLRYSQSISYERLSQLLWDLYSLKISEGGISNLLQRANRQLESSVDGIVERLRSARLVCSDETSARVEGQTYWEWVFQNDQVCLHVIRPTRGKAVIDEVMANHQPAIWVSDLFSAQKSNPATAWQVCLAHQLRDCQYAIDSGDELFAPLMKRWLLRAIALGRRRDEISASTFDWHYRRLRRSLARVLQGKAATDEGQRLIQRYRGLQAELLLFLETDGVPPTNNSSEQALRPSVIFRKVTNGFRSDWGAELFGRMRSLIDTAKRQGIGAFEAISKALSSANAEWLLGTY